MFHVLEVHKATVDAADADALVALRPRLIDAVRAGLSRIRGRGTRPPRRAHLARRDRMGGIRGAHAAVRWRRSCPKHGSCCR